VISEGERVELKEQSSRRYSLVTRQSTDGAQSDKQTTAPTTHPGLPVLHYYYWVLAYRDWTVGPAAPATHPGIPVLLLAYPATLLPFLPLRLLLGDLLDRYWQAPLLRSSTSDSDIMREKSQTDCQSRETLIQSSIQE
jgi:hypothetical protein